MLTTKEGVMKKVIFICALLTMSTISAYVHADVGPNWIIGNITQFTTTKDGLLLMIDAGLPSNCGGTPYGWMLVPESNKTIIAMALTSITSGKKYVTLYTEGFTGSTPYCVVNQVQPSGF
jgi:hypothetical protein